MCVCVNSDWPPTLHCAYATLNKHFRIHSQFRGWFKFRLTLFHKNLVVFFSGFASAAVPLSSDQGLERSLKRLDQDVRRTGRISRRDLEEVLDEIRLHQSATSSQSLLVIRCCGKH